MKFKIQLLIVLTVVGVAGTLLYFTSRGDSSRPGDSNMASSNAGTEKSALAASSPVASPTEAAAPSVDIDRLIYNRDSFKAASLRDRLNEMAARRPGHSFKPEEVADALKSDVAWQPDSSIADKLPLSKEDQRDGRNFIRMDPLKVEALLPGDEMSLPILQAKPEGPLRMVVDSVEPEQGGNITWHGHLKDYTTENQVTFTRGDSLIVGGVTVPDKNYIIQIHGNIGWIADGAILFNGKHDAVVPPGWGGKSHSH